MAPKCCCSATPKPVLQKLNAAMAEALGKPEVKDAIAKAATLLAPAMTPEEAQAWVVTETQKWAKVITESGVKAEL